RAGQRATLSGRLVDASPDQVLSLAVVWGDGSDPERSTPDRAPFRLTHRYDAPGTYKVVVIWSDSLGQSNGQDLPVTVTAAGPAATPNQRFVAQAYLDLLQREADPTGLAGFTAFLDQGGSRAAVA